MDRESVPISGQSPANFGACQIHPCSAAVRGPPPLGDHPPRARPPKPMLHGIARFCTPSFVSHLSVRVQNPTHSLSPYAILVRFINPRARWRVCVRAAGEKPPAMIAVYGREKPSRSDDVIAISSLSRNGKLRKKRS